MPDIDTAGMSPAWRRALDQARAEAYEHKEARRELNERCTDYRLRAERAEQALATAAADALTAAAAAFEGANDGNNLHPAVKPVPGWLRLRAALARGGQPEPAEGYGAVMGTNLGRCPTCGAFGVDRDTHCTPCCERRPCGGDLLHQDDCPVYLAMLADQDSQPVPEPHEHFGSGGSQWCDRCGEAPQHPNHISAPERERPPCFDAYECETRGCYADSVGCSRLRGQDCATHHQRDGIEGSDDD